MYVPPGYPKCALRRVACVSGVTELPPERSVSSACKRAVVHEQAAGRRLRAGQASTSKGEERCGD
jgi:hypothetical protein